MTDVVVRLLHDLRKKRPQALSAGARELAESISKDKKLALKALRAVDQIANSSRDKRAR